MFDISDVIFGALLLLANSVINGAGQDLWVWIRDRIKKRKAKGDQDD